MGEIKHGRHKVEKLQDKVCDVRKKEDNMRTRAKERKYER